MARRAPVRLTLNSSDDQSAITTSYVLSPQQHEAIIEERISEERLMNGSFDASARIVDHVLADHPQ
jgi:hypothetical protein